VALGLVTQTQYTGYGYTGLYPLLGADEISGYVVIDKSLSCMSILTASEQQETLIAVRTARFIVLGSSSTLLCFSCQFFSPYLEGFLLLQGNLFCLLLAYLIVTMEFSQ